MKIEKKYLSEKEVSEVTGIALPTLRNHRHQRRGIPYVKYGKSVRYDFSDVLSFMDNHKIGFNNSGH